jgi:hypothetical protein
MAGIPEPLPGPTSMNSLDALKNAAIDFAFNPKDLADRSAIQIYSRAVDERFTKDYIKKDPMQVAMASVAMYLKAKTRRGGGRTYRKKKHLRKTRKM